MTKSHGPLWEQETMEVNRKLQPQGSSGRFGLVKIVRGLTEAEMNNLEDLSD